MNHWKERVTLFRRSVDATGKVTWSSRFLYGCYWIEKTGVSPTGGSSAVTATRAVRIPMKVDIAIGDIVVNGAVLDSVDEYTVGKRSTDLRKKYPASFTVRGIHDNVRVGRPIPHIYAEGA